MSTSASLTIKLKSTNKKVLNPQNIINALILGEWRIFDENKVLFLPIGDNDYDWQSDSISYEDIMSIIETKYNQSEVIGFLLFWEKTNIGIHILIHSEFDLAISLSVNRKKLKCCDGTYLTDVNWYMERLIPALNNNEFLVESFSYEECY